MKRKILFMMINMNIGGTEKALLNMIGEMPAHKYDITILMLEKYGGFLDSIPARVHVEYVDGYDKIKDLIHQPPKRMVKKYFSSGQFIKGIAFLFIYMLFKITRNRNIYFKYLSKSIPNLVNEYDVAVAYAGPMDFISYFIVNKVAAKRKIQWIHFDVSKVGFDHMFFQKASYAFDQIYVVSKEAKNKLIHMLPKLSSKIEVFLNIVSPQMVRQESVKNEGFKDGFTGIRILTVGRLSFEKGQDLAIKALKKLKNEGYQVRWYCIGEGPAKADYEGLIKQDHLADSFVLLGSKTNPYPYMKQCDIYVQPSRYEGYCITLLEAISLSKPIITTDVNGAREMITHGETGLIVAIDIDQLYQAIKRMIQGDTLKKKLAGNLEKYHMNQQNNNREMLIELAFN